jgi:signal peptidase I
MSRFSEDLRSRLSRVKPTRWLRFAIVTLIFLAWVAWLGSWWVVVFLPLLFDIYITGYIPLTWWKQSKSVVVRSVMSWVDAIVYALVLVYFVFIFIGQNYAIPSSSLEKTLLVGDYLWVNKMAYGPRVPMTPVHFPLVHNRLPIIDTKSYLDKPLWEYKRLKGLGKIQRGDIVVFNFPKGDTVTTKTLESAETYYDLIKQYGRQAVYSNPARFGEVIWLPVDRRQNYVKRAIGLPGNTLEIRNDTIIIDGKALETPENAQFNYFYQFKSGAPTEQQWRELGVSVDERYTMHISPDDVESIRYNGFYVAPDGSVPPIYVTPLTRAMVESLQANPDVANVMKAPPYTVELFPEGISQGWTLANFGPIHIPARGESICINADNWPMYDRAIRVYEGNSDAHIEGDHLVIGGKKVDAYTFKMDYYFMMGDNRDASLDSRFWGFVPEDHVVGQPWRVLISFDKDRSLFDGKIRWNRIFKTPNPDGIL